MRSGAKIVQTIPNEFLTNSKSLSNYDWTGVELQVDGIAHNSGGNSGGSCAGEGIVRVINPLSCGPDHKCHTPNSVIRRIP